MWGGVKNKICDLDNLDFFVIRILDKKCTNDTELPSPRCLTFKELVCTFKP